jgi:hypothetical protein
VALLGFHKGRAQVLMAGSRLGTRHLSSPVEVVVQQDSLIWAVATRPQVCFRSAVTDPLLCDVLRATDIPSNDVALVPVFDQGRPVLVVLGQGRTEAQIQGAFESIKSFLAKVAKALRIVALKIELRRT